MRVGFIGTGNMATALVRGMVAGGFKGRDITVYDIDASKMMELFEDYSVCMASSAQELAGMVDVLILAVKPQVLPGLLPGLSDAVRQYDPLVVYIAAGTPMAEVAAGLGDRPLVRVMPNLAAKVGESMTAFCANDPVTPEQKATVRRILESVGDVIELPEGQFSVFTALAGCSPAFLLLYMDALATAGVRCGMAKDVALRVAAQTVLGTTRMLQEAGEHPRALMDQVCSPAGTTIEGMAALLDGGFEAAVHRAVKASFDRDRQLSGN